MKLLFFLAVWKRPEITEICFMGLNRLKKLGKYPMESFAVISEESMIPLCDKYGIDWCMAANHPLGAKKNYGVKQALRKDFDYMIEIGSDDLFKNEFLDVYKWDAPVLGLMDFALINTSNGHCKKLKTNIPKFGAGRAIQRFVLESFKLWTDGRSRGMDNDLTRMFAENRLMQRGVRTSDPVAIGLKSDINIWLYQGMPGVRYPLEKALEGLSDGEKTAIESLYATAQV